MYDGEMQQLELIRTIPQNTPRDKCDRRCRAKLHPYAKPKDQADRKGPGRRLFEPLGAGCDPKGEAVSPSSEPVTVTPSGSIRGSWLQTRRGRRVQAYRGVRYAAPPTGELRFQPPKPILQYPSEVDAKAEGPACPQPVIDPDYFVDEDCLRLNVYTPEKKP
ncbi:hypothetical protein evm_014417 [Chilo suppressalis]|nr:hypothetical protein evm_014417 [Chilo suppressalis]